MTANAAFIARLKDLRATAGSPTLGVLRRHARQLDGAKPADLPESTTHDILSGKRTRLPTWQWVATFVRACCAAARETGLQMGDSGELAEWLDQWRAAHGLPEASPATAETAPEPVPPPVAEWVAGAHDQPMETMTMSRYLKAFGRTGGRLLRQAERGDGDACFKLGVITMLSGSPNEAREWLRRANAAGHPDALELYHDPFADAAAAKLSFEYGRQCETEHPDRTSIAVLYYKLAANDHPEAAYRLGQIHQAAGQLWAAASWFSRAAHMNHPAAAERFDEVSKQISEPTAPVGAPCL
ncbi:sel1 repeat family protein [Streptosporangiaceae bacterium NEAU-GS5]|nr:sel1 repeat family protein [Streptosporangiaceae bacterium NEAU-GS5]